MTDIDIADVEIDETKIESMTKIGGGNYGSVYKALYLGKEIAVKVILRKDTDSESQFNRRVNAFKSEIKLLTRIHHPNVCQFLGACTRNTREIKICMELLYKDLDHVLITPESHKTFYSLADRMRMGRDAALGMEWLHGSNPMIIHRDLKPANLMLDSYGRVKVCDFGLSQLLGKDEMFVDKGKSPGSPVWKAPELFDRQHDITEKVDVYAFGLILWQLLTRDQVFKEFFSGYTEEAFGRQISAGYRPEIPPGTPRELAELMRGCWEEDPDARPSFSEVVQGMHRVVAAAAIPDEEYRYWWMENFSSQRGSGEPVEQVDWPTFIAKFPKNQEIADGSPRSEQVWSCFKAILDPAWFKQPERDPVIRMDRFGLVVEWLKGFHCDMQSLPIACYLLAKEPWFFGDSSKETCNSVIRHFKDGAFLVRFSVSTPGAYSLVYRLNNTACHALVRFDGNCYILNKKSYATIFDLVKSLSADIGLRFTVPGSPYAWIFHKSEYV